MYSDSTGPHPTGTLGVAGTQFAWTTLTTPMEPHQAAVMLRSLGQPNETLVMMLVCLSSTG